MAYFDSPKNRAMWEKEMAGLRTERELRKSSGFEKSADEQDSTVQAAEDTTKRELTSFRELQLLLGILLCFLFCCDLPVQAGLMDEVSLTTSDPENGYRYEWDHYGGFYSNVLQGENVEFAYFSIDETLDYQMLKDGEAYAFVQGDLLLENGSYTLYLFQREEEAGGGYCTFDFQIVSDYFDITGGWEQTVTDRMSFPDIGVQESEMSFFYDKEQEMIRFGTEERELLVTNIPNGAIVAMPVYLKAADGVTQTIYRNGEYISHSENGIYEENGFYKCIQMVYPDMTNSAAEDNSIIMTVFHFWIVDGKETYANVIATPEGFFLDRVFYQGAEQEVLRSGHYFLQGEGNYRFCFTSMEDAGLSYTLELTKDTTAPFLDFDQEIEGGRATAPLFITSKEPSCSYKVVRNGVEYHYVQEEPLKTPGYYEIVVSDEYGNSRKYTVLLEASYEFFSPGMILLMSSLAVILLIILYRSGHDISVV